MDIAKLRFIGGFTYLTHIPILELAIKAKQLNNV
jgi:hypothetical protein